MSGKITLSKIEKKFAKQVLFKDYSYTFLQNQAYIITGGNGSGKSTLLQIIAGYLLPNKGEVGFHIQGQKTEEDKIYRQVAMACPYLELIEEFTLREHIEFQGKFHGWLQNLETDKIAQKAYLEKSLDKQIKYFSSGMKQRTKLLLAILSSKPWLFLDEPCTNLDDQAIGWYQNFLLEFGQEKGIIIASNHSFEYDFLPQREIISLQIR